jgi:hypothetical protein
VAERGLMYGIPGDLSQIEVRQVSDRNSAGSQTQAPVTPGTGTAVMAPAPASPQERDQQPSGQRTGGTTPTAATAPSKRKRTQRPRPIDFTRPITPDSMRIQIKLEYEYVVLQSNEHQGQAIKWGTIGSWTRVVLTFTSGISALSIFAHSTVMAATFAAITVAVSALNAGFNPPETAKRHHDTARAYGHLTRPLSELLYKVDGWSKMKKYVPQQRYHDRPAATRGTSGPSRPWLLDEDMKGVWELFLKDRERIEAIDETAPDVDIQVTGEPGGRQSRPGGVIWRGLRHAESGRMTVRT